MDFQHSDEPQELNEGFVQRVWDSDPTTFYVEFIHNFSSIDRLRGDSDFVDRSLRAMPTAITGQCTGSQSG